MRRQHGEGPRLANPNPTTPLNNAFHCVTQKKEVPNVLSRLITNNQNRQGKRPGGERDEGVEREMITRMRSANGESRLKFSEKIAIKENLPMASR